MGFGISCVVLVIICLIYMAGALLLRPVYRLLLFSPFLGSLLASVIIFACMVFSAIVEFYFLEVLL